jgi:hypothetical protein
MVIAQRVAEQPVPHVAAVVATIHTPLLIHPLILRIVATQEVVVEEVGVIEAVSHVGQKQVQPSYIHLLRFKH